MKVRFGFDSLRSAESSVLFGSVLCGLSNEHLLKTAQVREYILTHVPSTIHCKCESVFNKTQWRLRLRCAMCMTRLEMISLFLDVNDAVQGIS